MKLRIHSIFGSTYSKALIKIDYNKEPYSVSGYIGNLSILKRRQGEQYIFLNGRFIKNKLLNSAIYSAYQSLLQRGEYPFIVLFLKMPYANYDVNVHPSKLEVKFINEWQIYHVIKTSITSVLQDTLKVIPDYNSYKHYFWHISSLHLL